MKRNLRRKIRPIQIIAMGFALMILVGTLLLMLPISSQSGEATSFSDALFTATSACCVTGLVIQDTASYWSLFGQIVLIVLIQIGGLGFMSVATMISLFLKRKISLSERGVLRESINVNHIGGVVKLTKKVLFGTLIIEGFGALLLMLRFVPQHGLRGIYESVFHSISAFCNAGFDLMGNTTGKYSSLVGYTGDALVNVTIMLLIIVGGIGFFVWDDITKNGWHFKKYSVHTRIVLVMTAILVFGGAILFYLFERSRLFADIDTGSSVLASFFQSVTTRTAGFNSVDIASLSDPSKMLTVILMFIGGSPGSTAGGIKTTTLFVMILALASSLRNSQELNVFRRRLEPDVTRKSICVFINNLTLAIVATLIICAVQGIDIMSVMLETFSAISTVGISAGITRDLNAVSRLVIIVLMYCGRVGSLSFAMSFSTGAPSAVLLPETKINIG